MTYQTQPGTLPHRAVEFLKSQPQGAEFTTVEVCQALGIDPAPFTWTMEPAVRAGVVRRRFRPDNRRILYWSLGDGTPPAEDDQPRTNWVKPQVPEAVKLPPLTPVPRKARKPKAKAVGTLVGKPVTFRAGVWTDGKLQLESGDNVMLLTADEVDVLRRLLNGGAA